MQDIITKIKHDLRAFDSLALIGLRKNVGKTTTLNSLLEILDYQDVMLTSIGYDGESSDLVFDTKKPTITIKKGMIIATAKKCLLMSEIYFEIMETTGFISPLGEIVIARVLSDGLVELAGPSTNYQLRKVNNLLHQLGDGLVIVDGALNRQSFSDPSVCEKTILCTGMVLSDDIEQVVKETKYAYDLLTLNKADEVDLNRVVEYQDENIVVFEEEKVLKFNCKSTINQEKKIITNLNEESQILYLNGPFSDNLGRELIKIRKKINKLTIILKNGTQIFLSEDIYKSLLETDKYNLRVIEPIDIYAISINPTSLYVNYDSNKLVELMSKEVDVLVFDLVGGQ